MLSIALLMVHWCANPSVSDSSHLTLLLRLWPDPWLFLLSNGWFKFLHIGFN